MRRGAFFLLLFVLVVLVVELATWATYGILDGRPLTPGRAQTARSQQIVTTLAPTDSLQLELMGKENRRAAPRWLREDALHPYLGFVKDPNTAGAEAIQAKNGQAVTEYGFVGRRNFLSPAADDAFIVGVFGGSVAFQFCAKGADAFVAELKKNPTLADKRIELVRVALGGYKQPQQLMALNYFLVLGAHFDLVINLDGVNETALPWRGYEERKVHPIYPRDWALRVLAAPDLNLQQAAGEISYLVRARSELAEAFGRAPWRYSATWNLVWKLRDNRLAEEQYEARIRYGSTPMPVDDFAAQGPSARYKNPVEMAHDLATFWQRSSEQMSQLCAGAGIPYVHFLQPSPHVAGSKPHMSKREQRTITRGDEDFKGRVADGYPLLQRAGAKMVEEGIAFFDLTGVFVDVEEQVYVDGCCHMNELGNEIMARRMAAGVLDVLTGR